MTAFSSVVHETWIRPFTNTRPVYESATFRLAIDSAAETEMRVQILTRGTHTTALVSPTIAMLPAVREARSEDDLRAALARAGEEMNGADHIFFLPEAKKAELRKFAAPVTLRRLDEADRAAFAEFEAAAPKDDLDEAYVELDHWAVFGRFVGNKLVAVGSTYPFKGDSLLADLGVVTLPEHRGQGLARSIVYALCKHALAEGMEPQYRCQLDNLSSFFLAGRAGFVELGRWDAPAPKGDDDR